MPQPASRLPRTLRRAAKSLVVFAVLMIGAVLPAAAHADGRVTQPAGTPPGWYYPTWQHGCPPHQVCLYPRNSGWNGNVPARHWAYWKEGHYWVNLHNAIGYYRFFNNGGYNRDCGNIFDEELTINTGYNGGGRHYGIAAGNWVDLNLTPYNSFTLTKTYIQITHP